MTDSDFLITLKMVMGNFETTTKQNAHQEFQLLELESAAREQPSRRVAVMENNLRKNRYKDILPYDYNRVPIFSLGGESDFINASFITDHRGEKMLIASQAPLPTTISDFWNMCWTHNVECITMLCDFIENKKKKCEQYFPAAEGTPMQTGNIIIELKSLTAFYNDFFVRELIITNLQPNSDEDYKQRTIKHVQYTGWPDFGVSDSMAKIEKILHNLQQTQRFEGKDRDENPSVVVHCSAGCGRTGTIACLLYISKMLQLKELPKDFSLVELVLKLRKERQNMVQSESQYYFTVQYLTRYMLKKELETILTASYEDASKELNTTKDSKGAEESVFMEEASLEQSMKTLVQNDLPTDKDKEKETTGSLLTRQQAIYKNRDKSRLPSSPNSPVERSENSEKNEYVMLSDCSSGFENPRAETD